MRNQLKTYYKWCQTTQPVHCVQVFLLVAAFVALCATIKAHPGGLDSDLGHHVTVDNTYHFRYDGKPTNYNFTTVPRAATASTNKPVSLATTAHRNPPPAMSPAAPAAATPRSNKPTEPFHQVVMKPYTVPQYIFMNAQWPQSYRTPSYQSTADMIHGILTVHNTWASYTISGTVRKRMCAQHRICILCNPQLMKYAKFKTDEVNGKLASQQATAEVFTDIAAQALVVHNVATMAEAEIKDENTVHYKRSSVREVEQDGKVVTTYTNEHGTNQVETAEERRAHRLKVQSAALASVSLDLVDDALRNMSDLVQLVFGFATKDLIQRKPEFSLEVLSASTTDRLVFASDNVQPATTATPPPMTTIAAATPAPAPTPPGNAPTPAIQSALNPATRGEMTYRDGQWVFGYHDKNGKYVESHFESAK